MKTRMMNPQLLLLRRYWVLWCRNHLLRGSSQQKTMNNRRIQSPRASKRKQTSPRREEKEGRTPHSPSARTSEEYLIDKFIVYPFNAKFSKFFCESGLILYLAYQNRVFFFMLDRVFKAFLPEDCRLTSLDFYFDWPESTTELFKAPAGFFVTILIYLR